MKKSDSTVILSFHTWMVIYYLSKGFVILKQNYKHLISVPNEEKQRIHGIDIHK